MDGGSSAHAGESFLIGLAAIVGLGIGAQWLAWRLRLPSILVLLLTGFVAGPVTGFLDPGALLGDLLFPLVSVSVGIILFEGGMTLRIAEFHESGKVVRNLIVIGVLVTWLLAAAAAHLVVGFQLRLAVLIGAILTVTGPTVILPLLRYVRPAGSLGAVLKWEGILNDPVGAMLAVLIFDWIAAGGGSLSASQAALGIVKTIAFGSGIGAAGVAVLVLLLRRYWIPDFLQNAAVLMVVILSFVASNLLQAESGLFAVTVMGILFANQRKVSVRHIVEFKENLRVLLISVLFIILAARLPRDSFEYFNLRSFLFLGILILVVRPAAVFLSSLGSGLSWRERLFLAWMAPRGVVAAAVTSLFALRLGEMGYQGAGQLVPVMFLVIIGTIVVYGLTAYPLGRSIGVVTAEPQGVLMAGAHDWARKIAMAIKEEGFTVLFVDTNRENVVAAGMLGFGAHYGNIHAESILEDLDLSGIGKLVALTPNVEANSLAALHFAEVFGRQEVYQLAANSNGGNARYGRSPRHLRGRSLFSRIATYDHISDRFERNAEVKTIPLTREFDYEAFQARYSNSIPLFVVTERQELRVMTADSAPRPAAGQRLICIVEASEKATG